MRLDVDHVIRWFLLILDGALLSRRFYQCVDGPHHSLPIGFAK